VSKSKHYYQTLLNPLICTDSEAGDPPSYILNVEVRGENMRVRLRLDLSTQYTSCGEQVTLWSNLIAVDQILTSSGDDYDFRKVNIPLLGSPKTSEKTNFTKLLKKIEVRVYSKLQ